MKKHRLLYFPIAFLFLLSFVDCAKRGNPSGGLKDSIPPVIVKSSPENYTINFKENEIRIYFNEYIKLKDLSKELIISPPLKYTPVITPLNTSKYIKIKILDTLKENTTYSFNFGNSIVDNNEENVFKYFKYIFSTGDFIDSLKLSGSIKDAKLIAPDSQTTVMLYEVNENFNDSIIFLEKPTYITTTQDSTQTFELTNIKEGNYLLIALKEINNDYIFQPKNDKIGFVKEYVTIPTDSFYKLTLFKENPEYSIARPKHISKNHILFGFQGNADNLYIGELSMKPEDFTKKTYRDLKTDTLHYWFKPATDKDTLLFLAINDHIIDTLIVRMRDLYQDSLKISAINSGSLRLKDTLKIKANTPLVSLDSEKIKVIDKDSVTVSVTSKIDYKYNLAEIIFNKTENQSYSIQLLPGAITDFFENTSDTLNYRVTTKEISDYGTLNITLSNVRKFPLIVQLVTSKFDVVFEEYLIINKPVFFEYISPQSYYIRIIYDENENGIWDTGNFLEGIQPEKIIYYPSLLDIRANWSLNETFILD